MLSPIEKMKFWTGIMSNHGEFILTSLSYNEQGAIRAANYYKEAFAALHEQSGNIAPNDTNTFNRLLSQSLNLLMSFINFKRLLLARQLTCRLDSSLPPTFYNHMINEAMEFCHTMVRIQNNVRPNKLCENIELNKLWITDAAGHAAIIACDLDPTEKILISEAQEFEKVFNWLSIKTQELSGMLIRTCLDDGSLELLNEEAKKKLEEFICFLSKIRDLKARCKVMGVLRLLIPDHMLRESYYYLRELESVMSAKK